MSHKHRHCGESMNQNISESVIYYSEVFDEYKTSLCRVGETDENE